MAVAAEQQFCLRWNNYQANITSQIETLRDNEDFTDVTIACDGQRIQAHRVVLSACSPFFKELFKSNPCSHPIIFMRDVEVHHIFALLEFMYAGEVNVAQTDLSTFLRTAESLKIRGLTDPSTNSEQPENANDASATNSPIEKSQNSLSTVTSSQDLPDAQLPNVSSPPSKRPCKVNVESSHSRQDDTCTLVNSGKNIQPKVELPDYLTDEELDDEDREGNESDHNYQKYYEDEDVTNLPGGMDIIPQASSFAKEIKQELSNQGARFRMRRSWEHFTPFDLPLPNNNIIDEAPELSSIFRNCHDGERNERLVKLGEGIEIYEEQLRSVKWSDYRKLTRGLATILFSPTELATCSVTGQRWSRAGNCEPVKPALDKAKVQAIISYVANRFPLIEISRIKQVLAYKCKENSTALKMKAGRYYGFREKFNK